MSDTNDERRGPQPLWGVFMGFGFFLLFLAMGLNRPTIADMRTVDLLYLLATGGFFGVGLVWLILYFKYFRSGRLG